MGRPQRGVVGCSRYAKRLRQAIVDAARDRQHRPILISGEPGLKKDNLAALIHFGSSERRRLLVRLDATDVLGSGRNLLDQLGDNSLVVDGIDQLDPELQQRLIGIAQQKQANRNGRVLFISEASVPPAATTPAANCLL